MKQTEIGMIPDDWEVKRLGDNVDIFRGGSPRPIEKYLTTNADGINWIKIGDVRPNDKYIHQTEEKIISEGKARSREVKKGDFILSNSMSFGRPYILNIDGCIHDGWLTIQNYAVSFDKEYLYYLLGSDEIFKQYVQMAAGSSVQNLNKEKVSDLQLKVPPLPEQQRIAKALSDVDALISTTEKLLQKKKNIKQGTMQELLTGKKRLPGFAKSNNTKMTELGEIPEDWEVKKLGEFTRIQAGGTPSTLFEEYWNGNIRWMNSGELNMKRVYEVEGRITELGLANSSTHLFPKNCVLIGLAGQGKTRGTAAINYVELCTNQSIAAIFPSFSHNSEFLYQNIDNRYNELRELSDGGGGRGGLNLKIIGNLEIALPPKKEQISIAKILSDMDNEIDLLNTKLEKYRNLKTAMMQQLLTGKIRLV